MLTTETLRWLITPSGAALLERLAQEDLSDQHQLRLLTLLRRDYTPSQAGAALEQARLRLTARAKFGDHAARMFFTREALEQASHPLIRQMRSRSAHGRVTDVCCSIGSDTLAFAASPGVSAALGVDRDPLRIAIAQVNADVLELSARFEVCDVTSADFQPSADLIFFDPARRDAQGKRIFDVERYQPPLGLIRRWQAERIVAKLSPGVDMAQLQPYGGVVEFVSVDGDLKEALFEAGEAGNLTTRARLLGDHGADQVWQREGAPPDQVISPPRAWLIEPDPALIRAGLVADAAQAWGAAQLDETIAYLTADQPPQTLWARAWRVVDSLPFHVRTLRAWLRQRGIGSVTVKKRGSAVTPEALIAQLRLRGDGRCTLVLTRFQGKPIVLICEEQPEERALTTEWDK
jgi:hypothetical protein